MNKEESNRLIAQFMGAISKSDSNSMEILTTPDGITIQPFHESEIRYDTDWNWLMPVIDRIENTYAESFRGKESQMVTVHVIGRCTSIHRTGAAYRGTTHQEVLHALNKNYIRNFGENKMRSIYKSIIEFIKLHNLYK